MLIFWFFASLVSYMIFVNLSSTWWYFFRKGNKDLDKIKFEENIILMKATNIETSLQNKLNTSFVDYNWSPKSISKNVNLNN